jgi:hypothetical protein
MAIQGMEGLSDAEVRRELDSGARFVVFKYTISLLVVTFQRNSDIYFIRPGESALAKGMPWTLLSMALGWWGFPFGLIFTPVAIFTNLTGGKDVTAEVTGLARRG